VAAQVEEEVELLYVVGEDGRVSETAPFQLLRVVHRPFAEAVIIALRDGRYNPGQVQGCPVPMLARQVFDFRIRR
jgi:hypothetical protein